MGFGETSDYSRKFNFMALLLQPADDSSMLLLFGSRFCEDIRIFCEPVAQGGNEFDEQCDHSVKDRTQVLGVDDCQM